MVRESCCGRRGTLTCGGASAALGPHGPRGKAGGRKGEGGTLRRRELDQVNESDEDRGCGAAFVDVCGSLLGTAAPPASKPPGAVTAQRRGDG